MNGAPASLPDTRDAALRDWLRGTDWAGWRVAPLAGDASARRYSRLSGPGGATVIAMDDPGGAPALRRFAAVAALLRGHGLAAPAVLAHQDGLAIVEDMGSDTVAALLARDPGAAPMLYGAIADLLGALHQHPAPGWLSVLTPDRAGAMIAPLADHYAPGFALAPAQAALVQALRADGGGPMVIAHRDFHAENLTWRPDQAGLSRIGLLDFQDAVAAPPAYDLASLIRDARRDVDPAIAALTLARHAAATGTDPRDLDRALAVWGVQRNLRILGIFAGLAAQGKPRYTALLPRVWRHVQADLAHPALAATARHLRDLPAPEARP